KRLIACDRHRCHVGYMFSRWMRWQRYRNLIKIIDGSPATHCEASLFRLAFSALRRAPDNAARRAPGSRSTGIPDPRGTYGALIFRGGFPTRIQMPFSSPWRRDRIPAVLVR